MPKNQKTTSSNVASKASKILTYSNSSEIAKSLAASALSQKNKGNQTGNEMEDKAAKVSASGNYLSLIKKDNYSQSTSSHETNCVIRLTII